MKPRTFVLVIMAVLVISCNNNPGPASSNNAEQRQLTVGVSFETLQTEYWVDSIEKIKAELKKKNATVLEAIADGDANRQFEQVNNFITQKVDGIIIAPKDAKTVIPIIKAANQANIPIVLYNRPPDKTDAKSVTVVADNRSITKDTVDYMCQLAKKSGKKHKGLILIGDLGDINAIERRDGFEDAIKNCSDVVEVVSRVPTEWNQEKAQQGLTNALQINPDISFIFTSSDFLFPSIVSALKSAGKYKKVNEDGHVILGGFDGDATAYRMLEEGYLDADGVQDLDFESQAVVNALIDLINKKNVPEKILDKGFVIHQDNLKEMAPRMWGAQKAK
jgi:ABC-type sugar transport system substrate-binding protein